MDDENLRVEALNVAAKLAMSTNRPEFDVLARAREFYGFLTGNEVAPVTAGTYSITINNPVRGDAS